MQTYFTELPSPSLKHKAHKYTSKKLVNGKWQYFYDYVLTGRGQKRDAAQARKLADSYRSEEDTRRHGARYWSHPEITKEYLKKAYDAHENRVKYETQAYNNEQNYKNYTLGGKMENAVKKAKNYIDTSITGKYYKGERDGYAHKARIDKDSVKEYNDRFSGNNTEFNKYKYNPGYADDNGKWYTLGQRWASEDSRNYHVNNAKAAKANRDYETKSLFGKVERTARKTKESIADTFKKAASKAKKKKKSK